MATLQVPPEERNGATQGGAFSGNAVAPHGATERVSYTVPAGKQAIVTLLHAMVLRQTVAAPVGRVAAVWSVIPSGAAERGLIRAQILTNAVGDKDNVIWGGRLWLFAGDRIRLQTVDDSTGGTVRYDVAFAGTEFDVA